jgi:hypothetical protein
MTLKWVKRVGIVATVGSCALAGCSDDPTPAVNVAGTTNGGSSAGHAGTGTTAGSAVGGNATAGTATTAGTAGLTSVAGSAGHAGSGGTTSGGGTAGTAGGSVGGEGGGGEGGASNEETLLFDFETDIQGWEANNADVILTSDATQFVTGAKALKAVVPALAVNTNRTIAVKNVKLWPGAKVVLHLWTPAGTDNLWAQVYTQSNNWTKWDTAGGGGETLVRGGWTTLAYTVPDTFPGGLQLIGVQVGAGDGGIAGGDFFIDSVVASDGVASCEGTSTGGYDFETAPTAELWKVDGNPADPADPDTVLAQSTTQAKTGTGALKVAFTALEAATVDVSPARRVFAEKAAVYCGHEVTFNVWTPVGSEALTFQAFAQFDNYSGWDAGAFPATVTRGGWTEVKYTLPATIGPGGLQNVGIQFLNNGTAFTGDVYIDGVTW